MTQTVLVTGGAGYIGSHTCKALALAGLTPVTYDSLVTGNRWAVKWGPLEEGDIADKVRLAAVLSQYKPSAVIHFAAFAYVGESVSEPAKYYANNVIGTLSLLDVMRQSAVNAIVFSSSCATYGVPPRIPIIEDMPQVPINPYGRSKLYVEGALADYSRAYGLRAVALRYFNAAGADPDGEIGEQHDPETHLIPLVIEAAADASKSITVFGSDYDTCDGTCVRDYIHVSDIADAHVRALGHLEQYDGFHAFNLGTGRGFSNRQIIDRVAAISERPVRTVLGARRLGDPPSLIANADLAKHVLGWEPRRSDLDAIVKSAWSWRMRA
jgi:UDP-arabinose 4-epimerase